MRGISSRWNRRQDGARIVIDLIRGVGMMRSYDPEPSSDDDFAPTVMAFTARGLLAAPDA